MLLVDTNVIIEAVRTGCWRAITGQMTVETVEICKEEAKRGDREQSGYVVVSDDDLARISHLHAVTEMERAGLTFEYPEATGMDAGERDLFAHAYARTDDGWVLCSPDKASIRAAVILGWSDRLRSLGALVQHVGARPKSSLRRHFEEAWLSEWRTHFRLAGGLP